MKKQTKEPLHKKPSIFTVVSGMYRLKIIIGIVFLALALVIAVQWLKPFVDAVHLQKNGAKTSAVIVEFGNKILELGGRIPSGGTHQKTTVEYVIDGRTYVSEVLLVRSQKEVGDTIDILYDPKDADRAVYDETLLASSLYVSLIVPQVILGALFLYWGIRRR